jgi:hypothetical protein
MIRARRAAWMSDREDGAATVVQAIEPSLHQFAEGATHCSPPRAIILVS